MTSEHIIFIIGNTLENGIKVKILLLQVQLISLLMTISNKW